MLSVVPNQVSVEEEYYEAIEFAEQCRLALDDARRAYAAAKAQVKAYERALAEGTPVQAERPVLPAPPVRRPVRLNIPAHNTLLLVH